MHAPSSQREFPGVCVCVPLSLSALCVFGRVLCFVPSPPCVVCAACATGAAAAALHGHGHGPPVNIESSFYAALERLFAFAVCEEPTREIIFLKTAVVGGISVFLSEREREQTQNTYSSSSSVAVQK